MDGFIENEVYYKSVEHYFQGAKFIEYDDKTVRQQVLEADNADKCKKIARKYQDQDKKMGKNISLWGKWEEIKEDVMRQAIKLKFDQNPELREKLIATQGKQLVEDSPVDMYWGGALPGSKNRLGILLMEHRDDLIKDLEK